MFYLQNFTSSTSLLYVGRNAIIFNYVNIVNSNGSIYFIFWINWCPAQKRTNDCICCFLFRYIFVAKSCAAPEEFPSMHSIWSKLIKSTLTKSYFGTYESNDDANNDETCDKDNYLFRERLPPTHALVKKSIFFPTAYSPKSKIKQTR